ncbi:MAG: histidine--tRNA ligase [Cyanobacteria bacterium P01_D01_bin.123]
MGLSAVKGTRDILPDEVGIWQKVERAARDVLSLAGYQEIRPPIFEFTDLFVRGIGEATDVVDKEMYSFRTKGDDDITLRPEGTAGVVRSYIQHSLHAQGDVQRLWYCGPMFRYERPQKGRQRQFHQIGLELLGTDDPRADAEAIAVATDTLKAIGLANLSVSLNSVGSREDRQAFRSALTRYLEPFQDDLDPDSQARLIRNPLRILDSKVGRTQELLIGAPQLLETLCPESRSRFDRVRSQLEALGITYAIDPKLVRGLDYYTHTAFEIQSDDLGAQNAVCGGGRYDGLVSELGGPETASVGWAMGMERLILLLQEKKDAPQLPVDVYVVSKGEAAENVALAIAQQLRGAGIATSMDFSGSAFKKQFKRADRSGATWAVIIGDAEAESDRVQLKHLESGEQVTVERTDLVSAIRAPRS